MLQQHKIVILGSAGIGKSSLINRYIHNEYNENIPTTLGAVYFEKIHKYAEGKSVKLQFWDTAGQEKFRAIAKIYYKDAKAAILMYDVSQRQTFQGLKIWLQELRQKGPQNLILAIVGNKTDLLQHQVPVNEAQQYASSCHALFKLISVKENKGIQELFDSLAVLLERGGDGRRERDGNVVVDGKGSGKEKGGKEKTKCC